MIIENYPVKFGRFEIDGKTAEKLSAAHTLYLVTSTKIYRLRTYPTITVNRREFYTEPLIFDGKTAVKRGTYTATDAAGVNRLIGLDLLYTG